MINKQKPKPQQLNEPMLSIAKIFYTLQGEGPLAGRPAVFIRLAGCNLACTWCDTIYNQTELLNEKQVVARIESIIRIKTDLDSSDVLIVLTGGEPFRQRIGPLCHLLHGHGYPIQIETNGTLSNPDFPWHEVILVVSPKVGKLHKSVIANAQFYKYVVSHFDSDSTNGLPVTSALEASTNLPFLPPDWIDAKNIYLSPLDLKNDKENELSLRTCVEACLKFGYTLSLQQHKILNLP